MKTVFNIREARVKLASIVRWYRTEIKALEVDCFRCVFDCVFAPVADITT